jgi:hypothetical protein
MGDTGPSRSPVDVAWEVDSPAKLAEFLADLAERARSGETRVENSSSVAMIEASGAWVEDIGNFLSARCRDCSRPVSPGRSPNPACPFPGTGLSTVSAVRRG